MELELTRLAADASLREQLRAAGLEHARRFDWRRTAARTLEIYARAVAREKTPARRGGTEFTIPIPHISREAPENSGGK